MDTTALFSQFRNAEIFQELREDQHLYESVCNFKNVRNACAHNRKKMDYEEAIEASANIIQVIIEVKRVAIEMKIDDDKTDVILRGNNEILKQLDKVFLQSYEYQSTSSDIASIPSASTLKSSMTRE